MTLAGRAALRPVSGQCLEPDGSAWVLRVDPHDGSRFVLRDTPVLLRLSRAADPASVSPCTVWVGDPVGPVPSRLRLSADGQVVIWEPRRLLQPGIEHVVVGRGLLDERGREFPSHRSVFVPCGLARDDLSG